MQVFGLAFKSGNIIMDIYSQLITGQAWFTLELLCATLGLLVGGLLSLDPSRVTPPTQSQLQDYSTVRFTPLPTES